MGEATAELAPPLMHHRLTATCKTKTVLALGCATRLAYCFPIDSITCAIWRPQHLHSLCLGRSHPHRLTVGMSQDGLASFHLDR